MKPINKILFRPERTPGDVGIAARVLPGGKGRRIGRRDESRIHLRMSPALPSGNSEVDSGGGAGEQAAVFGAEAADPGSTEDEEDDHGEGVFFKEAKPLPSVGSLNDEHGMEEEEMGDEKVKSIGFGQISQSAQSRAKKARRCLSSVLRGQERPRDKGRAKPQRASPGRQQ